MEALVHAVVVGPAQLGIGALFPMLILKVRRLFWDVKSLSFR